MEGDGGSPAAFIPGALQCLIPFCASHRGVTSPGLKWQLSLGAEVWMGLSIGEESTERDLHLAGPAPAHGAQPAAIPELLSGNRGS